MLPFKPFFIAGRMATTALDIRAAEIKDEVKSKKERVKSEKTARKKAVVESARARKKFFRLCNEVAKQIKTDKNISRSRKRSSGKRPYSCN